MHIMLRDVLINTCRYLDGTYEGLVIVGEIQKDD
jgi:hypothetical protein